MATIQHSLLTAANIHEPKGVDAATIGQVYVADGAGSGDWATVNAWNIVTKLTTTSRTNNTLTADPDLVIPMSASKIYLVRGMIVYTAAATPDLKYDWSFADNVTASDGINTIYSASQGPAASTPYTIRYESKGDSDADQAISGNDTTTFAWLGVHFVVSTNTNANTLTFRWAQNTTNATATTVRAGSYLEYRAIN